MNALGWRAPDRTRSVRRFLREAHAWAGFAASLFIAAMALSGSVLLFKDELRAFSRPRAAEIVVTDPVALGHVLNEAEHRYGASLRYIRFASPQSRLHEAALTTGGAYLGGDGQVVEEWTGRRPLDWLVEFHHKLFLDKTGATIIGVAGVVALSLVFSGLWLWWPMRGHFRPNPVPVRNARAALLASHRDLGVLLAPVLLVSIATGTVMALPAIAHPLFGFKRTVPDVASERSGIDWRKVLPQAAAQLPNAVPRQVIFGAKGKAATIRFRGTREWNREGLSMIYLAPDGAVLSIVDAQSEPAGAGLYGRIFPLHSGQLGSLWVRLLLLAGGLGLTLVSLLGAEGFRRRVGIRMPKCTSGSYRRAAVEAGPENRRRRGRDRQTQV